MRDPKRISKMMELIKTIWRMNPDLRLGQMLGNITNDLSVLYYMEDDELFDRLQKTYLKNKDDEIDNKLNEIMKGFNKNG